MDGGSISKFTTDSELLENGFIYAILETKLELSETNTEPVLQLGWYYIYT